MSKAHKALLAERYGSSAWFTARPDNTDGPTARMMMADEFDGACGELPRVVGMGCDNEDEGQPRANEADPLGTTSTHPKGT